MRFTIFVASSIVPLVVSAMFGMVYSKHQNSLPADWPVGRLLGSVPERYLLLGLYGGLLLMIIKQYGREPEGGKRVTKASQLRSYLPWGLLAVVIGVACVATKDVFLAVSAIALFPPMMVDLYPNGYQDAIEG